MSQLDSQCKTISGHKFEVFKLGPFEAQDVLIDIGQVLAPALGKAAKAFDAVKTSESVLDLDVDDPRVSTGIAALVQGITKERMRQLINTMASVTHCDGTPLDRVLEVVFRGDLSLMYQWLWFALTVNFGNFIGWAADAMKGVSKLVTAAPSPNTLGGTGQQ